MFEKQALWGYQMISNDTERYVLGINWGIIWGIIWGLSGTTSGACLGQYLGHIVNNGQKSAVLHASFFVISMSYFSTQDAIMMQWLWLWNQLFQVLFWVAIPDGSRRMRMIAARVRRTKEETQEHPTPPLVTITVTVVLPPGSWNKTPKRTQSSKRTSVHETNYQIKKASTSDCFSNFLQISHSQATF